jgi:hypothetical protein
MTGEPVLKPFSERSSTDYDGQVYLHDPTTGIRLDTEHPMPPLFLYHSSIADTFEGTREYIENWKLGIHFTPNEVDEEALGVSEEFENILHQLPVDLLGHTVAGTQYDGTRLTMSPAYANSFTNRVELAPMQISEPIGIFCVGLEMGVLGESDKPVESTLIALKNQAEEIHVDPRYSQLDKEIARITYENALQWYQGMRMPDEIIAAAALNWLSYEDDLNILLVTSTEAGGMQRIRTFGRLGFRGTVADDGLLVPMSAMVDVDSHTRDDDARTFAMETGIIPAEVADRWSRSFA